MTAGSREEGPSSADAPGGRVLQTDRLSPKERYQLLTSLVVPRPIGWVSTREPGGSANLAPFSFYTALSSTPMLVGVSVGLRDGTPKDTLRNLRRTGGFCVNVVGEAQLEVMNDTAAEVGPEVDEAGRAGLELAEGRVVEAPYVASAPAVLECTLFREVALGDAPVHFVVGEVRAVHLGPELRMVPGTRYVESESFRPVARLYGSAYGLLGEVHFIHRRG